MLEFITLIYLWKLFGKVALEKGQPPLKYRLLLLMSWFSCEFLGLVFGYLICMCFVPSIDPFIGAYFSCLPGAILGGVLAWNILKKAPNLKAAQNDKPKTHMYNLMPSDEEDALTIPATLHIIEEFGESPEQEDTFMLNGYNICSLKSGCEYTMRTFYRKNILKISGTNSEIRFIASENGYIEVHATDGKIIPELFKNYTSK